MGVRSLIAIFSVASLFAFAGCSKDEAQKVQPETRGQRGENCQARNDCASGLACLNGICAKNEFDISVEAKHCDRIECAETSDCCGDKPTEAPAKCADRDAMCTPNLPGCTVKLCTADTDCGGGTCRPGTCSNGGMCATAADCTDTCVSGFCSKSGSACSVDVPCLTGTCNTLNRTCNCANPDYVPGAAICTDPDCDGVCTLRCEDERCLVDHSCKTDTDCAASGLRFCDGKSCVQCKKDVDCGGEDSNLTCVQGACKKPCEHNEECKLFEECNADSGECEYVGCHSDRECVLAATRNAANPENPTTFGGEDPRMLKCLESEADPKIKTCKIPCENDGSCGSQSVCDGGFCKFVGCKDNEECRGYLGLTQQVSTPQKPFVTTAVCRE